MTLGVGYLLNEAKNLHLFCEMSISFSVNRRTLILILQTIWTHCMDTKFFYLSFFRSRSGNTEDQRKLERVEQNIRTILENVVLLASKVLLIFRIFGSLKFPLDLSSCLSCMKITTCLNSLHLMFTKW